MKNRIFPIGVFLTLMLSSLIAGHHGYANARKAITTDLNQALIHTIQRENGNIIPQDTIRLYKQLRKSAKGEIWLAIADERFCRNLDDPRIRKNAFITFDVVDMHYKEKTQDTDIISSDTVLVDNKTTGDTLAIKSCVRLSAATVFSLSDQRLSYSLMLTALVWAFFTWCLSRAGKEEPAPDTTGYGGIYYSADDRCFHDLKHKPVHLTPMQRQLLLMLWEAPSHTLSKEEICTALWPKKDNANDTLYTLVRRLRPILESHSSLKIVAYRGQSYALETK